MSSSNPASRTALAVVGPNAAIRVLFCLKFGKFVNSDVIPDGLKNAMQSYVTSSRSDQSAATVL